MLHDSYIYRSYPKYSDRQASANHADPDQMQLQNVASGLHCLPLILHIFGHINKWQKGLFQISKFW